VVGDRYDWGKGQGEWYRGGRGAKGGEEKERRGRRMDKQVGWSDGNAKLSSRATKTGPEGGGSVYDKLYS